MSKQNRREFLKVAGLAAVVFKPDREELFPVHFRFDSDIADAAMVTV